MKTRTAVIVTFASAVLGAAAALAYCYGPLLRPSNAGIKVWASYYEGWIDAKRQAMRGRASYSFDRYMVEGLREYAAKSDDIGAVKAPPTTASEARYLWGFDSAMEGAISKRLQIDFPEGYVRRYVETGWIDMSQNQPARCPVHGTAMQIEDIPFQVVFPFTIPHEPFEWEIAGERLFPFAGSTKKVDASLLARPRNARIRVCVSCTVAEQDWFNEHPRLRQLLNQEH